MRSYGGSLGIPESGAPGGTVPVAAAWIPAVVLALMAFYFLAPDARLDFTFFDTHDSESYLALSRALVSGLGYTRSLDPLYYVPHTTWPPGLPAMLMPAVALAGMPVNLLIVKLGMIAYGAAGIGLAHLYARRMSRSTLVRLGVPLLLALDPYYWQFSRMTLSEMPTTVWALLALLLADIGWARGLIRPTTAVAFGLVAGFGMLIRGSFFGALFLPLVYLFWRRNTRDGLRPLGLRYLLYAAGFVLPFLLWHVRNSFIDRAALGADGINQFAMLFKTLPVDPASPYRAMGQILDDMHATLASVIYQLPKPFVPGLWSDGAWHVLGDFALPAAALTTVALLAISVAARRNLPIVLMYASMGALNLFYADGAMTRLWVPVAALIAVSLPLGAERLRIPAWACAALAAGLAASLALYIVRSDAHPYRNAAYAELASMFERLRDGGALAGNVLTPEREAFALVTGLNAPPTVPGIGVEPDYSYIVMPTETWVPDRLAGRLVLQNGIWSVVALAAPQKLAAIQPEIDCKHAMIPGFAILANCPIW